ncbi:protease-like activity factor CPAF [Simkania negevensis]|uniref:Protease-like activity factor CPAF n=1 Tax=Simkania negevensis TaxID=83561 RepID=A0ABS3ASV4_9BACT|nr:protease-like activity factor CPAF [Simkania negevensis]
MVMNFYNKVIFGIVLMLSCGGVLYGATPAQEQMLRDLDFLKRAFEVKYAPHEWKKSFAGWTLNVAIAEARQQVLNDPLITIKGYQRVVRDLLKTPKDYHVGATFLSTERAYLPFRIKSIGDRYFITFIDRRLLPRVYFNLEEGDELLTFGGAPIADAVNRLRKEEVGDNVLETDRALAELFLTMRVGALGHVVPQGHAPVTGRSRNGGNVETFLLKWQYTEEKVKDDPSILRTTRSRPDFMTEQAAFDNFDLPYTLNTGAHQRQPLLAGHKALLKQMATPVWLTAKEAWGHEAKDVLAMGARKSYLPDLGSVVWRSSESSPFDAYVFKNSDGKWIGYIRIASYEPDGSLTEAAEAFATTMRWFNRFTSALVVDQLNNPGGIDLYAFALMSMLTDRHLETPKHKITLTQEEVYHAAEILPILQDLQEQDLSDRALRNVVGDDIVGYTIDNELLDNLIDHYSFVISEWEEGKTLTRPTHMHGIKYIKPSESGQYTRPILMLINELDFSCGDFVPAILQDNSRVTLMGTRTGGAGGYVEAMSYPNLFGTKQVRLTASIAERITPEGTQTIENLGVTPDIPYTLTETDLQENFRDVKYAINSEIKTLLD